MRAGTLGPRQWWWVCILLVGIGLAESAYLLGRVFTLLGSPKPHSFDLCSALFSRGCDAALADERFWIAGVPLAGWGLVYFASLGGLLFLARFMRDAFDAEALLAGTLVTVTGVGTGLALSVSMWAGQAPFCPLCLTVHATSLALLIALRQASAQSFSEQARLLRVASEWLVRSAAQTTSVERWKLVGFGSVALLAVVAYQWVYVESALRRPAHARPPDPGQLIAAYDASAAVAVPVTEEDPRLGPLTAPVRMVVFESFRCPSCRRMAGVLSQLHRKFGNQLLIVFKHYPLSTQCNLRLTRDMQPGACEAAWAAEAAHRQSRFWAFHDALFAARPGPTEEAIAEAVRHLDLDSARFAAERRSQATKDRVTTDVELGNGLDIPGTPSVFLNGHLLHTSTREALEILIRHELGPRVAGSLQNDRTTAGLGRFGSRGQPP